MKANELTSKDLMVGDWVIVKGVPTKIYDIDKIDGINREWIAGCEDGGCTCYKDIQPIPLTPEILEKSGFNDSIIEAQKRIRFVVLCKEYQLTYYFNNNWFSIYKNVNESDSDYPIFICAFQERIKYVHELQHALRLCGIEKEIVL